MDLLTELLKFKEWGENGINMYRGFFCLFLFFFLNNKSWFGVLSNV